MCGRRCAVVAASRLLRVRRARLLGYAVTDAVTASWLRRRCCNGDESAASEAAGPAARQCCDGGTAFSGDATTIASTTCFELRRWCGFSGDAATVDATPCFRLRRWCGFSGDAAMVAAMVVWFLQRCCVGCCDGGVASPAMLHRSLRRWRASPVMLRRLLRRCAFECDGSGDAAPTAVLQASAATVDVLRAGAPTGDGAAAACC